MEQRELYAIEARCTQEAPPKCQTACPFGLDVRAFVEKVEAGKIADARKLLERHVPLPDLLARLCDHPCESACVRRDFGGGLAINALERFCVAQTKAGKLLARTSKIGAVTILGSGLAGLVAAADLSKKGYVVTVFHDEEPESVLHKRFPGVGVEQSHCMSEGVRFERAQLDKALLERHRALGVVFVDVDACPTLGVSREQVDAATLLFEGICYGGWLQASPTGHVYASASQQGADGRKAATTMQRQLEGVSLTAVREEQDKPGETRLHVRPDLLAGMDVLPRVMPRISSPVSLGAAEFTEDEARAEAARCIRCSCMACAKECVFLQKYRSFPRVYARQIYNNMSIVKGQHLANRLVNGCALCGQCTEICPERFSMAELCLSARQDMVNRAYMPQSAHAFALEDMANACGPAHFVLEEQVGEAQAAFALFPGCQLPASRPDQTATLYERMRPLWRNRGGLALLQTCCGVPAHWAGQEALFQDRLAHIHATWEGLGRPHLLMACASCLKTFNEFLPDVSASGVWEALNELDELNKLDKLNELGDAVFPVEPVPEKTLVVHDPCGARHNDGWRSAVRSLAAARGVTLVEPRLTDQQTACCGYGGLVWNADPPMAQAMTMHRAEVLGKAGSEALTSCIMCRDRLARSMPVMHILDLLVPFKSTAEGEVQAAIPGLSARRAHRARFKARFTGEAIPAAAAVLRIPDSVLAAMEDHFILRSDVENAVAGVESCGKYFVEMDSGHRVGSWRPGAVTFWVRYTAEANGFVLHDAWCHRMRVPGASHPNEEVLQARRLDKA